MNHGSATCNAPLNVHVGVNGVPIQMELDTGSGVSSLTETDFAKISSPTVLRKPTVVMKGFSGNSITCVGETTLSVTIGRKQKMYYYGLLRAMVLPCWEETF